VHDLALMGGYDMSNGRKRKFDSNAERQAAYRARARAKRNNADVTAAIADAAARLRKDWVDQDGNQHVYLGNWGFGDQFALIRTNPPVRDRERQG
jgi:hypothetical protein